MGACFSRRQARAVSPDLSQDPAPAPASRSEEAVGYIGSLGGRLLTRFENNGEFPDLELAIEVLKRAVNLTPDGHPEKAAHLSNLGASYQRRFEHLGELSDIEQAILITQQAADLTPDDHPHKLACLNNLGTSLQTRFERLAEPSDIDRAISVLQQAVDLVPDGHPAKPSCLDNLGTSFQIRFESFGESEDIGRSISAIQRAVDLTLDEDPSKPAHLSNLGASYQTRFERLGELTDLEHAIFVLQQAVNLVPDNHSDKASYLNDLGISFQSRFERLGELEDIEQAVLTKRRAVQLTPDGHPHKPGRLGNLGSAFQRRFEHLGKLADIDRAILVKQQAVNLITDADPDKPAHLSNLGNAFHCRFERLRGVTDLERAISAQEQALDLTPDSHPHRPAYLSSLGVSYQTRFEHLGQLSDIERGIALKQQSVDLTPADHPDKPSRLSNLGTAFQIRFEHVGELADLERAISAKQEAVDLTPENYPDKPMYLNDLGIAFQSRFERLGELADIEQAISVKQQAVTLVPDGHPDKPAYLHSLGSAFNSRFKHLGEPTDVEHATSYLSTAAMAASGPLLTRLRCARDWAALLFLAGDPQSTLLTAHATVMNLIPQIAWLGLGIFGRLENLTLFGSAVSEAVAAAIACGSIERALEWLEEGRAVIWGQLLQLRTPIDELRSVAPEIANELQSLSLRLESSATRSNSHLLSSSSVRNISLEQKSQQHLTLASRYQELIEMARALHGFEDFLRPRSLSFLCEAAASGIVIMLNVDESRCDALALPDTSGRIIHIPLPELTHATATSMYSLFNQVLRQKGAREDAAYSEGAESQASDRISSELQTVLEELWKRVAQPILSTVRDMGPSSPPEAGHLPRIWWCGTGPLAFLPLHAAGIYGPDAPEGDKTFHHVVSSYTPSLGTLLQASRLLPTSATSRLLAVSQPATPGQTQLPNSVTEVHAIQECIGDMEFTWLNGEDATRASVLRSMEDHSWVHFACHCTQSRTNPMESAIRLYDGRLDLADIMKRSLPHAEIAVLSACQTPQADEQLPEEAVQFATGMLMAGYRHVIGTMWAIVDSDGPILAEEFYGRMMTQAGGDSAKAAYVLHHAVEALRGRIGEEEFLRWVPFIHFGA